MPNGPHCTHMMAALYSPDEEFGYFSGEIMRARGVHPKSEPR